MVYNAKNGYGLKLTKFDDQYEDCIIYRNTKEEIIELADKILRTFGYRGLMSELNEMQGEVDSHGSPDSCFKNKYSIPSYFINLLLKGHSMAVLGW